MAILTKTWTTASVGAASNLECNLSIGGAVNEIHLFQIQITPSASGGLSSYQVFRDDSFTGDIAWEAKANAMSPFYDPVKLDEDGNMSQEGSGYLIYYEDEDASAEFHIKIANAAAVGRTYEVKIWYVVSTSISALSIGDLNDVEDEPSAGYADGFALLYGASAGEWQEVDLGTLYYTETEIDGMILVLNEPSGGWTDGYGLAYNASAGVWNEFDLSTLAAPAMGGITDVTEPSASWTDGYVLAWGDSAGAWQEVDLGGIYSVLAHTHTLVSLTDVNEPSAGWTDGYVLAWSDSAAVWNEVDLGGIYSVLAHTHTLTSLTDVNEPSAGWQDGYVLAWSDSAGVWEEVDASGLSAPDMGGITDVNEPSAGWTDGYALLWSDSAGVWDEVDLGGIYYTEAEVDALILTTVLDADFTAADQIMVGTGISTHGQVTLAASQFLGKKASGAVTNLSVADVLTLLNLGSIYYTETEVDNIITALGNTYYTETEIDGMILALDEPSAGYDDGYALLYSESAGVWRQVDLGGIYYTETEVDNLLTDLLVVNEPSAGWSDGYALLWSDSAGVWNEVDLGGVYSVLAHTHTLNALTDITEPSAGFDDGFVLVYAESAGVWQQLDLGTLYYTETEIDSMVLALEEPSAGWNDGASLIYAESAGVWREAVFLTDLLYDTTPEFGGEVDAGAHTIGFTQQTYVGGASNGEVDIDWKLGNKAELTFDGQNETLVFTAPTNPCNLLLKLIQDDPGSRTATWPVTVMWPAATAPTLTTTADAIDIVSFYWDGTNYFGNSSLAFGVPA